MSRSACEAFRVNSPGLLFSWATPDPTKVGEKAAGLLALPRAWVPAFAVVSGPLARRLEDGLPWELPRLLAGQEREAIEGRLFAPTAHLVIRSDGPAESKTPGGGISLICEASWEGLRRGFERYRRACPQLGMPIVQVAIDPTLLGVMSNARPSSKRVEEWLVEGILDLKAPGTMRIHADRPARAGRLLAGGRRELQKALRSACSRLTVQRWRYRCEWAWDGTRVWMLQADRVPEVASEPAAVRYLDRHSYEVPQGVAEDPEEMKLSARFGKLASRRAFARMGLPLVPLRAQTVEQWRAGGDANDLLEELLAAWRSPIVVRTDVTGESTPFLLPTSAPLYSASKLGHFVRDAVGALEADGISPEGILLLFSPLLPAHVSALVYADARAGKARVDSLWGFPDGLLNLPHDSFSVEADRVAGREIRYKPACLLLERDRVRRRTLGSPYDWAPSLRADEVRLLARWGRELSALGDAPTALMALCRVGGQIGPRACFPFHSWSAGPGEHGDAQMVAPVALTVESAADLKREISSGSTVRLNLERGLDRDVNFIEAVGLWAARSEATLLFSGSLLGHTRALLERAGAVVISPDQAEIDWSDYRAAIVATRGGLKRVRMVEREAVEPSDACGGPGGLSKVPDISGSLTATPLELDVEGQPAMFMDDASR